MQTTNISNLKARLSEYLQKVKNGETVLVLDRDTPVARITPARKNREHPTQVRAPIGRLIDMKLKIKLDVDPAGLIAEDRDEG